MRLEQAILDRLEKRNAQIAQLQNAVHALERAADSQREHGMMERGRLLEENKKLADRVERMEESAASADMLRKSLNDEITKRDRELREMDAEAKAHREAIQKKDAEIQEWLMQLANARNERDAALREVESLRSQVPLESTREALKNAVAKLQQYKNDVAKLYEIADEIGRGTDESIADVMKRQGTRIAGLVTKLQEVTTERDRLQNEIDALNRETQTVRERNGSLNSTLVTIGSEVAKEWHL